MNEDPCTALGSARLVDIARYKLVGRPLGQEQRHAWHELVYVLRGRHRVQIGHDWIDAGPGQWLYHPLGQGHRARSDALSNYTSLVLAWQGPVLPLQRGPHGDAGGRLLALLELLLHEREGSAPSGVHAGALLVAALCQAFAAVAAVPSASTASDPVARTRRYLEEHLGRSSLAVAELAALAGLTRAHYTRRFHERYGEAPATCLRRLRLAAAYRQLITSDRSVGAIAQAVGFGDGAQLARALRRDLGRSPSELRRGLEVQPSPTGKSSRRTVTRAVPQISKSTS